MTTPSPDAGTVSAQPDTPQPPSSPGPPTGPPTPTAHPGGTLGPSAPLPVGAPGTALRVRTVPPPHTVNFDLALYGWINAHPGQGYMRFRLPDGTTATTVVVNAQNPADAPNITFSTAFETFPNGMAVQHVTWLNAATVPIAVDYSVNPA